MFLNTIGSITVNSFKNGNRNLWKSAKYLSNVSYRLNNFSTSSNFYSNHVDVNNKRNNSLGTCINFKRYLTTNNQPDRTNPNTEKYEFIAETKQLLNIVAKSLYSDKEIFIRELVSNSSDAIEKLRYMQLSEQQEEINGDRPYEIRINANEFENTLIIQDSGIGMTKAELIENLGTIAHSGSKSFLEKIANNQSKDGKQNIIGQFGVGFYSAFMVSDDVQVVSKSYKPNEKPYRWNSTGDGSYEISEVNEEIGFESGTKIIMKLKSESDEFVKIDRIKDIIKKHSNFVRYPIYVNDERINLVRPLWLEDPKNITQEQHDEFYQYIANPYDKPRYTLQYKTDAPMHIRSLFYIPTYKPNMFDVSQENDINVALYSKQVLILAKANQILPRWLRFIKGVVDSEDIPLNLSREMLQDSNLIKRLKSILTNRLIKFLNEQSKLDNKKFTQFYDDYKMYFKEAIARSSDEKEKEDIASLLRFETNKTEANTTITLDDYMKQMKEEQKSIYYFAAPTREIAMNSPYFEAIKQKDYEVLFLFEPHDEVVILQLGKYHKMNLTSIEMEIEKDKNIDDIIIEGDSKSLNNDEANELKAWLKNKFGKKVKNVKITTKLENHPCIVTTTDMGAIRHFIKTNLVQRDKVQDIFNMIDLNMEINPKNSIIKSLYSLKKTNVELAELLAEQLLDNALLNAGLIDDPRFVLKNLNTLLEKVFEKNVL
jgi:TNF receptor-associated protein 1